MTRKDQSGPPQAAAGGRSLGECPPGHDPTCWSAAIEDRIAAMRALLSTMRPLTDAEALHTLRQAFPGTSLADRVAALARREEQR
jgi:hypothetical protein